MSEACHAFQRRVWPTLTCLDPQMNAADVAKLEATAWLACVSCRCLDSAGWRVRVLDELVLR